MIKCFNISSYYGIYRYLMLEDGVLEPTGINVHLGEVREFNNQSFELYKSNLDVKNLDDFGKNVYITIVTNLLDVQSSDIRIPSDIVSHDNKRIVFLGYVDEVFENAHIGCSLTISLPSFKISELSFSDSFSRGSHEHSFSISDLNGYSVLTQKSEILGKINMLKKTYKKDIKLVKDEDSCFRKLMNKLPNFGSSDLIDNTDIEKIAEFRLKNNAYVGNLFVQSIARAADRKILEGKKN